MHENDNLSFGGHLEVLRKMLFRIISVTLICTLIIFAFKKQTFQIILAPSQWDFITYRWIEKIVQLLNADFSFDKFYIEMISTELSSQFILHITTSIYLAILLTSPYIVYELFCFISPALLSDEKNYSIILIVSIYILFCLGVFFSYFIIFPISFRFLGTYQVAETVTSTINLSSYISTFTTLTFMMGVVFQLPIITFFLARLKLISSELLSNYRRHAIIIIMIISAIITPPDLFTLFILTLPMYLLYELSIIVIKQTNSRNT